MSISINIFTQYRYVSQVTLPTVASLVPRSGPRGSISALMRNQLDKNKSVYCIARMTLATVTWPGCDLLQSLPALGLTLIMSSHYNGKPDIPLARKSQPNASSTSSSSTNYVFRAPHRLRHLTRQHSRYTDTVLAFSHRSTFSISQEGPLPRFPSISVPKAIALQSLLHVRSRRLGFIPYPTTLQTFGRFYLFVRTLDS